MSLKAANFRAEEEDLDFVDVVAAAMHPLADGTGNRSAMIRDIIAEWVQRQRDPQETTFTMLKSDGSVGAVLRITYRGANVSIDNVEVVGNGS